MARRKRQFLDDGDSSDPSGSENDDNFDPNEDPDHRAERELWENPYQRGKRRRVSGDDSDEEEGFGGRGRREPRRRIDWTKAPTFLSKDTVKMDEALDQDKLNEDKEDGVDEEDDEDEEEVQEEESSSDDGDSQNVDLDEAMDADKPGTVIDPTPAPDETIQQPTPSFSKGGIGSNKGGIGASRMGGLGFGFGGGGGGGAGGLGFSNGGGIGSGSKGGIGANKGGIGSNRPQATSTPTAEDLPTSFSNRPQRAFVRDSSNGSTSRPITPVLSAQERAHFNKLEGTFGARLLQQMGWQAGTGLGPEAQGIVTPIESKLRPKGMGIAFKGFKEKTEQSKAEARRRGEVVSDDEKPKRRGKGKGLQAEKEKREEVWKKPKRTKVKVEHKTYEQIIAEAGVQAAPNGIGQIIDATGAVPREVASLADVSIASWTPTADSTRIPEVRHNIRLIADSCKGDLDGLAKEAKAIGERRKWIDDEDGRLRRKVQIEADLIQRLQGIHLTVDELKTKGKDVSTSDYEPSLDPLSAPIEKLLQVLPAEFDRYRLDDIVVAAIAPIFRRMVQSWKPLQNPAAFTSILRKWKMALKMSKDEPPQTQVDFYGRITVSSGPKLDAMMTPYESLLWNIWLPKIRTCLNNDWDPSDAQAAVKLYEAWIDILPPFIRDNILDQLILPKVSMAIGNWKPQDKHSLQAIIFPWLPHVGLRFDEVISDAKRKMKNSLRSWKTADGVPKDFMVWKEIFSSSDWQSMLLKYIVPKLGATMRDDFRVNPRNQNMEPLENVLQWKRILRPTIIGQLLETEFFNKWLDVLHFWLIQPDSSFDEIAEWFSSWKDSFGEDVLKLPGVTAGFDKGLQLMSEAMELGDDVASMLAKPEHKPQYKTESRSQTPQPTPAKTVQRPPASRVHEITFKSIVEEFLAESNLYFMPAGKVEEKSRLPLYRVTRNADGRAGVLVYVLDDAVWISDGESYQAVSLDTLVQRALRT